MNELIIYENEISTNKIASRVLSILSLVTVICGVGGAIKFRDSILISSYVVMIFAGLIVHMASIIIYRKYCAKPNTKKIVLSLVLVLSGALFFVYPLNASFLLFGPIILSVKYYDITFIKVTSAISIFVFLLCSSLNYFLQEVSPAIKYNMIFQEIRIFNYGYSFWLMYVFPKLTEMILTAIICISISKSGKRLVEKQIETTTKANIMKTELEAASRIQREALPNPEFATRDGSLNLQALMKPAREVGGDLFDYFMINKNIATFIIADISDKGLASAIFGARLKSAYKFGYRECVEFGEVQSVADVDMSKIAGIINQGLCANNPENYFATVCMGCIDCRTGELKYVNAGHETPVIKRADGSILKLENEPQKMFGIFDTAEYKSHENRFEKGDCLFMFTDGVTDARNSEGECWGRDRLIQTLEKVRNDSDDGISKTIIQAVTKAVIGFVGEAEPFDDITAMAITYCGQNN